MSCGIGMIWNLYADESTEETLRAIWEDSEKDYDLYPIILFSDTDKLAYHHNSENILDSDSPERLGKLDRTPSRGSQLARFITKNRLGRITATKKHRNPQSENNIKCWMWEIDHEAVGKYAKKHKWEKPDRFFI